MMTSSIKDVLTKKLIGSRVMVKGWVRTFRSNRFIALSDGSTIHTIQAIVDYEKHEADLLKRITRGACISIEGDLTSSQGKEQEVEIRVRQIEILGDSNSKEYPLQSKKHSLEFLREIAHLRPRTNTFGAVFRIRHSLAYAIHQYFHNRGFFYLNTPIITGADAEGAGKIFNVSTLDKKNIPFTEEGEIDYAKDFFGKEANLTVSGQLEAELVALALGKVYTFGPTFRAENSNTTRHLAEFWMIEPEVAFYDLDSNMDLAEDFLKKVIQFTLENCKNDLDFLGKRLLDEEKSKPRNQRNEMSLIERLHFTTENSFKRVSYTEAIDILYHSKLNKKKKFQYPIEKWGVDLQLEHEKHLVKHFNAPVILFDYPANIKAFYMRLNDDGKTARAMDVLFPGIGEIVGGSQREERYDVLKTKVKEFGIEEDKLWWYLETRQFGTCIHSGFGLGFERLVQFVTGMGNIRDVIPFPRTPGNVKF